MRHPLVPTLRAVGAGRSALRELVERDLGEDVCGWVVGRRKADPALGVRRLAEELHALTGRRVHPATLHRWCPNVPD